MKVLVLTDHRGHSEQNSVYGLVRAMSKLEKGAQFFIASRGLSVNDPFFYDFKSSELEVLRCVEDFRYHPDHAFFMKPGIIMNLKDFDWILLRLPRPIPDGFFDFLRANFNEDKIINRPSGIELTGSKLFLLNYPKWCPPMKLCESVKDIREFADRFPIVIKPLENYGGKGLVRIDGKKVWEENELTDREKFFDKLSREKDIRYLGMKYLTNVHLGDKRIMISNEEILGASLRTPPPGSWLCNVAQGGTSSEVELDEREIEMVKALIPDMKSQGVVLFGVDTLAGNDGLRYLSEINTLSLGGLAPAEMNSKLPILEKAAQGIWNYIKQ
nr:glutathione synthetase [Saprospiraceae bacterium]